MTTGRFAPSPTGDLHLGNLRTAAVAWLSAHAGGGDLIVRMEDLDLHQANPDREQAQLRDLGAIGITWSGDVVRQSERFARYEAAIDALAAQDLVYECFCTRREIRQEIAAAASAPHGPPHGRPDGAPDRPPGAYPGTCRNLSATERARRRATGRPPALRLRGGGAMVAFTDRLAGDVTGVVDDVVLRRNDGVPAYNLAVVVDDAAQGVTEVVRGDDLTSSTPRQIHLQRLLGLAQPAYLHVPLVLDVTGARLAKRRGLAVTLPDLAAADVALDQVVHWIGVSLGLAEQGERFELANLVERFDPARLDRRPVRLPPWVPGA